MNDHLRTWLAKAPVERRKQVANAARTTVGHLWQLAGAHRKASAALAERLQEASQGEITIAGLRPDLVLFARKTLAGSAQRSDFRLESVMPEAKQAPSQQSPDTLEMALIQISDQLAHTLVVTQTMASYQPAVDILNTYTIPDIKRAQGLLEVAFRRLPPKV